jgi:hypothetical protein
VKHGVLVLDTLIVPEDYGLSVNFLAYPKELYDFVRSKETINRVVAVNFLRFTAPGWKTKIQPGRSYMMEWAQNHHIVALGFCLEHIVIEVIKSQSL